MMNDRLWEVVQAPGGRIEITFRGRLSGEDGKKSAEVVAEFLNRGNHHLAFDVKHLTSYDDAARRAYQEILLPKRANIQSITVRGANTLVRMGASVLAMALKLKVRFEDD